MVFDTTSSPSTFAFEDTLPTVLGVSEGISEAPRSRLGSSVWADLRRLDTSPAGCDLLGVLAACTRHAHSLDIHIRMHSQLELLSVYPQAQSFRCDLDLCALPPAELAALGLVHVELAAPVLRLDDPSLLARRAMRTGQLRMLLWQLAMHGCRSELLPEIAGPARFRLAPGLDLLSLPVDKAHVSVLTKMDEQPMSLDELARSTLPGRPGVVRLLNALYLQSGLIVTRQALAPWSVQRAMDAVRRNIPAGFNRRA
jgi:hypothetical protein